MTALLSAFVGCILQGVVERKNLRDSLHLSRFDFIDLLL